MHQPVDPLASDATANPAAHTTAPSSWSSLLKPQLSLARQEALQHVAEQYRSSRATRSAADTTTARGKPSAVAALSVKAVEEGDDDGDMENETSTNDGATRSPVLSSASGASPASKSKVAKIQKGAAPVSAKRRAAAQRKADEAAQAEKAEVRRAVQLARAQDRQGTTTTTTTTTTTSEPETGPDDTTSLVTSSTPAPAISEGTSSLATTPTTATAAGHLHPHHHHHHHHHHHRHNAHQSALPFMPSLIDEYRQRQHTLPNSGDQGGYGGVVPADAEGSGGAAVRSSSAASHGAADYAGGYASAPPLRARAMDGRGLEASGYPAPPGPYHPHHHQTYTTNTFGGMQRYLQQRAAPGPPPFPTPPLPAQVSPGSVSVARGAGGRPHFSVRVPDVAASTGTSHAASPLLPPPPSYAEGAWGAPSPQAPPPPPPPPPPPGPPPSYAATVGSGSPGSVSAGGRPPFPCAPPGGSPTLAGASQGAASSFADTSVSHPLGNFATSATSTSYASSGPRPDLHAFTTASTHSGGASSTHLGTAEAADEDGSRTSGRSQPRPARQVVGREEAPSSSSPGAQPETEAVPSTPPTPLLASARLDQPWAISCSQTARAAAGSSGRRASLTTTTTATAESDDKTVASMESEYLLQLLPTWSLLTSTLIFDPPESPAGARGAGKQSGPLRAESVLSVFPVHLSEVMAAEQVLLATNSTSATAALNSPTVPTSPAASSSPSLASLTTAPRYFFAEVELEIVVHPAGHRSPVSSRRQQSQSLIALERLHRLTKALRGLQGTAGSIAADDLAALLNDAMLTVLRVSPRFDSICDALVLASLPPRTPSPALTSPPPQGTVVPATTTTTGAMATPSARTSALTRELLDVLGVGTVSPSLPLGVSSRSPGADSSSASASEAVASVVVEEPPSSRAAEASQIRVELALPQGTAYVRADGATTPATAHACGRPVTTAAKPVPSAATRRTQLLSSLVVAAPGAEQASSTAAQPIGLQVEVLKAEPVSKKAADGARVVLVLSLAMRDARPSTASASAVDDAELFEALTAVLPAPLLFSSHTRRVSVRLSGDDSTDAEDVAEDVAAGVLAQWIKAAWGGEDLLVAATPTPGADEQEEEQEEQEDQEHTSQEEEEKYANTVEAQSLDQPPLPEETAAEGRTREAEALLDDKEKEKAQTEPAARAAARTMRTASPPPTQAEKEEEADEPPSTVPTTDSQPDAPPQEPCLEASASDPEDAGPLHEIQVNTMAAPLADLLQKLYTALRACRQSAIAISQTRGVCPLESRGAGLQSLDLAQRAPCPLVASLLQKLAPASTSSAPTAAGGGGGGGRHRQRGKAATEETPASLSDPLEALLTQALIASTTASDAALMRELRARRQASRTRANARAAELPRDVDDLRVAQARWAEALNPEASLLAWMETHVLTILSAMEAALAAEAVSVAATPLPVTAGLPSGSGPAAISSTNTGHAPASTVVGGQRAGAAASGKRAHRRGGNSGGATANADGPARATGRAMRPDVAAELSQTALHPLHYLHMLLLFAEQDALTVGQSPMDPAASASSLPSSAIPAPPPAAAFASAYSLRFRQADGQSEARVRSVLRLAAAQLQALIAELHDVEASLASAPVWDDITVPYLTAVATTLASEREAREQLSSDARRGARTILLHAQQQRKQQERQEKQEEDKEAREADHAQGSAATALSSPSRAVPEAAPTSSPPSAATIVPALALGARRADVAKDASEEEEDGEEEPAEDSANPPLSTPRRAKNSLPSARRPKASTPRAGQTPGGSKKGNRNSSVNVTTTTTTSSTPAKAKTAPVPKTQKSDDERPKQSDMALLRSLLYPFLGVALLTVIFLYFA